MNKSDKPAIEAVLKGGVYDGRKILIHEASQMLRNELEFSCGSKLVRLEQSKYKLLSNGQPLVYEFVNPN